VRTAIGVAALSFFAVLTLAGGQDVIAEQMRVSVTGVTLALRIMLVAAPVIAGAITWKWCHDLQAGDEQMHVHVGPGEGNGRAGIAPEPRDEHVARDSAGTAAGARSPE
jgi:ubiquinol-cytochrome c reductase cytochrome b subunit